MASTGKCEYCGSALRSDQPTCPNCGAANPNYVADTPRTVFLPKTIEELKEYCAERGMPLLRMRFFIGEDYRQPRAFGIYQDGSDFIVYKNKNDGTRAVRYKGPDEARAVGELFAKLLQECHNRGIYPDGKPQGGATRSASRGRSQSFGLKQIILIVVIVMILAYAFGRFSHRYDGYYNFGAQGVYYHYGSDWYYDDPISDWTMVDTAPYSDYEGYYAGEDFDSDWGVSNFKNSSAWDTIQESHSSSSHDYDSWDSGGTDWDSDW